jgi:solute carrier family 25 oxoglutarate transporter 11
LFDLDDAGELPYRNMMDCFAKTVSKEGFWSLWVGLPTFYFRVAPHAMIAILAQDFLHDLFDSKEN